MFTVRRLSLLTLSAAGLVLATPGLASAQKPVAGSAFGTHVSSCAQTMGFDANHNPGMHQGLSGWSGPMTSC